VGSEDKALIPVTTRAAYKGMHIYDILIERLSRLERILVSYGFDDPVPRMQFHLRILERLRRIPNIDSDETLWSLVEATELTDIYCTLLALPPRTFTDKFKLILAGPLNPQQETVESNHARNTVFELYLAGWLSHNGIPTEVCHNPDISCTVADRRVFIQCKRPFSRKKVAHNIKLACKQLSTDLDKGGDGRNRGVAAISLTHALNPGNMYMEVRKESDLKAAITGEIRSLADHLLYLIRGPRIVGLVVSVTTPALVRDINEFRTGQVMALYPSNEASDADRAMLRQVFGVNR
jgi:hypothetical protein